MVEKGVLLNVLVEGLLEKKGVEWTLIVLFLLMDVKLSRLFHWQQPKLEGEVQTVGIEYRRVCSGIQETFDFLH